MSFVRQQGKQFWLVRGKRHGKRVRQVRLRQVSPAEAEALFAQQARCEADKAIRALSRTLDTVERRLNRCLNRGIQAGDPPFQGWIVQEFRHFRSRLRGI